MRSIRGPVPAQFALLVLFGALLLTLVTSCRRDESAQASRDNYGRPHPSDAGEPAGRSVAAAPQAVPGDRDSSASHPLTSATASLRRKPAGPRLVVSGKVEFTASTPAAEATVLLLHPVSGDQLARAKAGADGQYRLESEVPEGTPVIQATAPGYAVEQSVLVLEESDVKMGARVEMNFILRPAANVTGTVTDEGGRPVAGAQVRAERYTLAGQARHMSPGNPLFAVQKWETVADTRGHFRLDELPATQVTLEASAGELIPQQRKLTPPATDVHFRLGRSGLEVRGHVFSQATGIGVAGAQIEIVQLSPSSDSIVPSRSWVTNTDELGAFRFSDLPEGDFELRGRKGDQALKPADPVAGSRIRLHAGEPAPELTLFLYSGHNVTGRVTEETSGKPVEGAEVSVEGDPAARALTDEKGQYFLAGVAPGLSGPWIGLSVAKKGYLSNAPQLVRLVPEQKETVKDLELLPVGTVSGRVIGPGGVGVAGAMVGAPFGPLPPAFTGSDGAYELEVPYVPAAITLHAKLEGQGMGFSEPFRMDSETTSGIEIQLAPLGNVQGVVLVEDETPLSGAEVIVHSDVRLQMQSRTGSDGKFEIAGVPTGVPFTLSVRGSPELAYSRPVSLILSDDEPTTSIKVVLKRSRSAQVRVTDPSGNPVEGVTVQGVSGEQYKFASGRTGADGRVSLTGLAADRVTFRAIREGFAPLEQSDTPIGPGEITLVIRQSRPALIIGSVNDARTSEPVSEFTVEMESSKGQVRTGDTHHLLQLHHEAAGVFTVKGLETGDRYSLVIRAPGYASFLSGSRTVPHAEGGEELNVQEERFQLQPQGSFAAPKADVP